MTQRVVITGIGIATPFGSAPAAFCEALLAGQSAAAPISVFDATGFITRIAAEVPGSQIDPSSTDRKAVFARRCAQQAVEDAQRHGKPLASHYGAARCALSAGLGLELFSMADMVRWRQLEADGASPMAMAEDFLQPPADRPALQITRELALSDMPQLHISACAASTDAIGRAFWQVRSGRMAWMLAGGADSMINLMGVAGFCKIEAMTTRNADPARASRPFDAHRDGFLLGEGGAFFVLEALDRAQARGARVYGELLGYGNSFDAHAISDPHPEGDGALLAMRRALADGALDAHAVRHVNAHGTSTPKNDPAEATALKRLFGEHIAQVTVNATKSMLGHAIGASGGVEIAAHLLCARQGWLHPTINLDEPDPAARGLDIARTARRHEPGVLLKNSFAFGGQNACLVLRT